MIIFHTEKVLVTFQDMEDFTCMIGLLSIVKQEMKSFTRKLCELLIIECLEKTREAKGEEMPRQTWIDVTGEVLCKKETMIKKENMQEKSYQDETGKNC